MCGKLNVSLYGTRDAAKNWEEAYASLLISQGFKRGRASPCQFWHPRRGIRLMVHGDGFVVGGPTAHLAWLEKVMGENFECKCKVLGPAKNQFKEIVILNRTIRWAAHGIEYLADLKHATTIIEELMLDEAKEAKTPMGREEVLKREKKRGRKEGQEDEKRGRKEEQEDEEEGEEEEDKAMNHQDAKRFRSLVARLNYLANDRPDLQFSVRVVSQHMASPKEKHWRSLKRIARYIKRHPEMKYTFEWQRMPRGVTVQTRKWNKEEEEEEEEEVKDMLKEEKEREELQATKVRVQTDSDWATERLTRRSVSAGAMYIGRHLVKSWSKQQGLTAMSSAEAELYAATLGGQQVLGLRSLLQDVGLSAQIGLEVDASAAIAIMNRQGLGRTRHIDVRYLWLQHQVKRNLIDVIKVPGETNTADIGTKALSAEMLERHMRKTGFTIL